MTAEVTASAGAEPEVIGYSPNGGYLIRGRRRDERGAWLEPWGPDDLIEVLMANALDQKVLAATAQDAVVVIRPTQYGGHVRRYLARRTSFLGVPAEAVDDEQLADRILREHIEQDHGVTQHD